MKVMENSYYRDKWCKHNVIFHVLRIEKGMVWGNALFVDEKEPCAILDLGIAKKRMEPVQDSQHIEVAKEMERYFVEEI